jgi:type I restriction enzyme S subunit
MSATWPLVPLSRVATLIERTVPVEAGKRYRTIGVKWWGEGAYERDTIDGAETAAKTLSLVHAGDLIINKIWVRHGSIAVATQGVDGCAASGEFPTFVLDREQLEPRWLHWLSKTRDFWDKCDKLSQGTSGKNRIKLERFLTIDIPLPPLPEQRGILARIEALAGRIDEAKRLREEGTVQSEALRGVLHARGFASATAESQRFPLADLIVSHDSGWSPQCSEEPAENGQWGVLKTTSAAFRKSFTSYPVARW